MQEENKYVNKFNWRRFVITVCAISFAGAGLSVISVYKDKSVLGITLGFILIGIGFAIIVEEWGWTSRN